MRTGPMTALIAGGLIILCSTSAFAKKNKKTKKVAAVTVTGLASMHTLTRARGRLCMADHYHFGDGRSQKSKAAALLAAKRDWISFVHAEYGATWSKYAVARSKGGKCTSNNGHYSCSISARPCMR